MSRVIQLLLLPVIILAASCQHDKRGLDDVCGSGEAQHVCAVPFEVAYAHRGALIDRNIRLEGVLVAGVRPEPPGSKAPVVLLFPSTERARICNPGFAIELVSASSEIASQLVDAGGGLVSVAGRLKRSEKDHWAELEVMTAPALISSDREDFDCMSAPPPPLPEPR